MAPSSGTESMILQAVNSLFAHARDRRRVEEAGEGESQASHPHNTTHLPVAPFANDFEEVKVSGPGTGGKREEHGSAFVSLGNLVPEIKPRLLFNFEAGEDRMLSRAKPPHHILPAKRGLG